MNKKFWLILFIATQLTIIIVHISKQSVWIKMSYTTQTYEHELTTLLEQKKVLTHTLYELEDPKKIKDYAQKKLGMKSLKIHDFKRISSHA